MRRVRDKETLLLRIAEAYLMQPDGSVCAMVFPVVGEDHLRDIVPEATVSETAFRARARTVLSSSYSSYYRRILPKLLAALEFRCNHTAYRPVMDALGG